MSMIKIHKRKAEKNKKEGALDDAVVHHQKEYIWAKGLGLDISVSVYLKDNQVRQTVKLKSRLSRDHLEIIVLKLGSDVSLTLTIYSQEGKAYSVQPWPNTVWSIQKQKQISPERQPSQWTDPRGKLEEPVNDHLYLHGQSLHNQQVKVVGPVQWKR